MRYTSAETRPTCRSPIDIDITFKWETKTVSHSKLTMYAYEQLAPMDDVFKLPSAFQLRTTLFSGQTKSPEVHSNMDTRYSCIYAD